MSVYFNKKKWTFF